MGNYFRLPDIDSFIQKVIVQGNCGFDISMRRKRINIIMIKLVILTLLFSVSFVPVFAQTSGYPECRNQIEAINKMPLQVAYLVPVDSLGQYMFMELMTPEMCDHCEVVADISGEQFTCFATLYFDNEGKLRKTIKQWADGGDLNNIVYYDKQGNIIYAVFATGTDEYGKLYSYNSQIYVDYSYSKPFFHNGFHLWINMTTEDLTTVYKVKLDLPRNCKSIIFTPVKVGDRVLLSTNKVYVSPNGNLISEDYNYFGRYVIVNKIKGDWCMVKGIISAAGESIGYIPADDLEIIR